MIDPDQISLQQIPKKKSFWIRILRWLVILFFSGIVLIAGGGMLIGYCYQDKVKDYVIHELNKQLNTEIIVDGKDIDFTVLKNFPLASVDFKNVKALEAIENKNKDTLFKADRISFQFNIVDIFKANYHIKKIEIETVELKIHIDKKGNDNYHFWKPSADTGTTAFSFALEKIVLKQIHFSYKDDKAHEQIDAQVRKSNLSGNFSSKKYSLETTSDLFVNFIKTDSTNFLRKKNIHSEVSVNVDNEIQSYKIEKAKIRIEELLFEVVGNVLRANNQLIMNLGFNGKNMDIKSVLSLIPNKYKSKINDYKSEGEFYFDATVQGTFSDNQTPQVKADFGIKNADITQIKENIVLHNVNLEGHYSDGSKGRPDLSELILSAFSATINQGSITGELAVHNLNSPSYSGKIKADIRLEELQNFIKIDTIETVTGQLKMDAQFSSSGKGTNSNYYENITTSGDFELVEMNMKLKNDPLLFHDINGNFKFNNNDLMVEDLTGKVSNSDFQLKGFFRNMIGFILKKDQDILVDATLYSKNINLNEILANNEEEIEKEIKKNSYKLKFSEHINVNLNSEIQHLEFRKFEATNIKGLIKLNNKKLFMDPVTLSTMNGTITTSGLIDGSDSTKLMVNCFSEVNKISITKMFESCENFGQTTIIDKNIKGTASVKIQFNAILSPELQIDMDKLYAAIDMTIENGELNNVESMKSLSRFIEIKELENVRFATLQNQIEIKNKVINIPKMDIKSNAINIVSSGTHTFNNEINYKIKLSLNDLLSKKAKQAKKENDEFGEIADDGLGRTNLFLSMTGTVDNPVIKYDGKSAVQNIKQDLKVEKQNLKSILKAEFGLFKKDSTLANKPQKEENNKILIKWDEGNKQEEKKALKKPKKDEGEDY